MRLADWFPYVIACGNVGSVLFTRNGSKHGWTLVILAQLAFIWYANTTGQPGFYVQNVLMIVVAGEALLHWHRTGGPDQLRKVPHVRTRTRLGRGAAGRPAAGWHFPVQRSGRDPGRGGPVGGTPADDGRDLCRHRR